MPDKEGSDDEKKSTKSVVNKKQKQFMNQEELDLTKIAEAFGGYLIEIEIKRDKSGTVIDVETTAAERESAKKAQEKQKEIFRKAAKKQKVTKVGRATLSGIENLPDDEAAAQAATIAQRDIAMDKSDLGGKIEPETQRAMRSVSRGTGGRRKLADTTPASEVKIIRQANPNVPIKKPTTTNVKPGSIPEPKSKPIPVAQKTKTFKQAFGRPTGADPKTGKPTYRVSPVGPAGEKRTRTRGGFKALPRSKNLPDYDTTKTAVDMGLNPDEIDKNKFIDQKVRGDRMDKLGTPDPFDPDYAKKVKKVDQRTKTAKAFKAPKYTVYGPDRPKVSTKVDTQPKQDFKGFEKASRRAKRMVKKPVSISQAIDNASKKTSKLISKRAIDPRKPVSAKQIVDRDIDRKIAQVAAKTRKSKIATPVVKTLGKEAGEAAVKSAGKKAMRKGVARALSKQIPGVGSIIAGGEAAYRAAKGDMTGAGLSLAQAVPGLGIGAAVADVARDMKRAKGGARVGQKVATQVATALPGTKFAKKVKTARKVKVVNPTVVGTSADTFAQAQRQAQRFMKNPKNLMPMMVGGAALGKGVEMGSRKTFQAIKPKDIKGGRVGRRSAKQ